MTTPWDPWLSVAGYKAWARIDPADTMDDAAIQQAVDASAEAIALRATMGFVYEDDGTTPVPVPAMLVEGGYLLVNRLMSRRNSPDGMVGVADMGVARIASTDADISANLSPWTPAVVA